MGISWATILIINELDWGCYYHFPLLDNLSRSTTIFSDVHQSTFQPCISSSCHWYASVRILDDNLICCEDDKSQEVVIYIETTISNFWKVLSQEGYVQAGLKNSNISLSCKDKITQDKWKKLSSTSIIAIVTFDVLEYWRTTVHWESLSQ